MLFLRSMLTLSAGALAVGAVSVPAAAAPDESSRIIGGSVVQQGGADFAVWIGMCSASIIDPQWILTARHCTGGGGNPTVYYGNVETAKAKRVQASAVYNSTVGDAALLKLSQPITGITPIKLADAVPPIGSMIDVYGWGRTSEYRAYSPSPVLKTVAMKYESVGKDCYSGTALSLRGTAGSAWKGDSGGPAVYQGKQVGILSTGNASSRQNWYATVAHNRDWIKKTSGI